MKQLFLSLLALSFSLSLFAQGTVKTDEIWKDESKPTDERVQDLLSKMTLDEKLAIIRTISPENKRLGIPKFYLGNEALHGIIRPGRFTVFPQAIGLASMWDPDLLYEITTAISDEARGKWNELEQGAKQNNLYSDLLAFFSPTINMARDPRWGRTPETYGEDPYLAAVTGTAFVKGLQGNDPRYLKTVATPKHFACNNEEHNRFECNAEISEKQLREYYLPAYEACVRDGHAASVMGSYTAINGVPSCCNPWLLTKVLRKEWGFDGYVVSDCGGVGFIYGYHHYTKTSEQAAALALKAGLDLECGDYMYIDPLKKAYKLGLVTDEDIDLAVGRVLKIRMRLGIFDNGENNPYRKIDPSVIGCQKHQDLALESARKSIVLLKNQNNILPLNKNNIHSIAVVGNNSAHSEFGDYSGLPTAEPVSVLQGIKDEVGDNVKVNYVEWKSKNDETDYVDAKYFPEGLTAQYYDDMHFTKLRSERKESHIFFEPANQAPDPEVPVCNMSAIWTGKIAPDVSGEYIFKVDYEGSHLQFFINGELMNKNGVSITNIPITLEKDKLYDIKIEYKLDRNVGAIIALKWKKPDKNEGDIFEEARQAASKSDVVVAVMGINKNYEREGQDRTYLELPEEQQNFLKEIYKVNKNVILVLVSGSSMAIKWEQENLPAIIDSWYGGQAGGTAVSDVLFGKYNPAGRLVLTFYKDIDQLPAFNDYDITKGRTYKYLKEEPLYPFGYGLSYSSFTYSNLDVKENQEGVMVNFNVKNSGKMAGDEVAQVYVKLKDYEGEAPIKELKGFKRISLNKGETKPVSIFIPREQLRYWSEEKECFVTTSLLPEIFVGASSTDIRLHQ